MNEANDGSERSATEIIQEHGGAASIVMAAREDSQRYYFRHPEREGYSSIPATSAEAAREYLDHTRSCPAEEFEQITKEEARSMFQ